MIEELTNYLAPYVANIEQLYDWPRQTAKKNRIWKVAARQFDLQFPPQWGELSCYFKTAYLKERLQEIYQQSTADNDQPRRIETATFFVQVWGGIRNHTDERSAQFLTRLQEVIDNGPNQPLQQGIFDFDGISSWSKILNLTCPNWAYIYDNRVAFAINAIQYIQGVQDNPTVFPMPGGSENRKITFIRADRVLLANLRGPDDSLRPHNLRQRINKATAYVDYLALIEELRNALELNENNAHRVEMLLFSLSDTVVYHDFLEAVRRNN